MVVMMWRHGGSGGGVRTEKRGASAAARDSCWGSNVAEMRGRVAAGTLAEVRGWPGDLVRREPVAACWGCRWRRCGGRRLMAESSSGGDFRRLETGR